MTKKFTDEPVAVTDEARALEKDIRAALVEGRLPCAKAFQIAKKAGVSTQRVGQACNALKIRIATCQLGCFP